MGSTGGRWLFISVIVVLIILALYILVNGSLTGNQIKIINKNKLGNKFIKSLLQKQAPTSGSSAPGEETGQPREGDGGVGCKENPDCNEQRFHKCCNTNTDRCSSCCTNDAECLGDYKCTRDVCVDTCKNDVGCPTGQICKKGICTVGCRDVEIGDTCENDEDDNGGPPPPRTVCSQSGDYCIAIPGPIRPGEIPCTAETARTVCTPQPPNTHLKCEGTTCTRFTGWVTIQN